MKTTRGQVTVAAIGTIMALLASVGAPFIWAGNLKATNAVQDTEIENLKETVRETKDNLRELNKKLDALLINNGINPDKLK